MSTSKNTAKHREDLRTDSIEPTCPSKPPMPALYHLKEYESAVALHELISSFTLK